jgi:hypothetical protein
LFSRKQSENGTKFFADFETHVVRVRPGLAAEAIKVNHKGHKDHKGEERMDHIRFKVPILKDGIKRLVR